MNSFIIYSLEIAISLGLFYLAYWVFLKKETFFKLNRFYLMSSVLICLLVPLMNISLVTKTCNNSFITKYLILPIEQYEENLSADMDNKYFHNRHGMMPPEYNKGAITNNAALVSDSKPDDAKSIPLNSGQGNYAGKKTNWLTIALVIYFIGVALFLIRFLANFIWIFGYVLRYRPQQILGMKVIRFEKNLSPFSFLNFIFLSNKEYPEAELNKIISHEKVHIAQKHSVDLILFELLLVFQWFNPFVWFYKRAIKITHEYLADQGTLSSGVDLPGYQYSLLNQMLRENNFEIVSSYNFSVKERIAMMMKKRSSKLSSLKLIVALPIFLFLFSAFAFNCKPVNSNEENKTIAGKDSTIKKVDVPVEYLRLLEGEYHSTNEPGRNRTIILTEVLGNLYGFDNGYCYKIIPVGGESFINPDDHASLVFNSKDKNNISLLLFGKINLNKVAPVVGSNDSPDRSMALTLTKVMLKDGIPAMLSYAKKSKDSTNYWSNEREINTIGYDLIEAKKFKEACALLKLSTERSGGSFSCFDTYGEALLASGDKTKAIEAFKESVSLNPGNKNGIKRLKELGVNPDDVIKIPKVSMEELKVLEGTYLSTDDHNWIRKINFKVNEGVLCGEDNGYNYKLIPRGNGKFVNPDDGASLVFDTKDKSAINLLLFGTMHLNKARLSDKAELNLKDYCGIYTPAKKDTILKPMEIMTNGTILFRYIKEAPEAANRTLDLQLITGNLFYYTDQSRRSIEFILNDKKEVTGCILRRWDGVFALTKQK